MRKSTMNPDAWELETTFSRFINDNQWVRESRYLHSFYTAEYVHVFHKDIK